MSNECGGPIRNVLHELVSCSLLFSQIWSHECLAVTKGKITRNGRESWRRGEREPAALNSFFLILYQKIFQLSSGIEQPSFARV